MSDNHETNTPESKDLLEETQILIEKLDAHTKKLAVVEMQLAKLLSRSYQFKLGLWRAVNSALGATIGIAIILIILRELVNRIDFIPILQTLLQLLVENIPQG